MKNEVETVEVYFDDFKVTHVKSPIVQTDSYYPFGLTFDSYSRENSLINKYQYNGKEKQDALGLDWLDYGDRMLDPEINRWRVQDKKSELYFATSPYVYALNQPTNAVDPDGKIVIFVNGNHFGYSAPQSSYWNGFDQKVMSQLNDTHTPRYYDGSNGGWHPLVITFRCWCSAREKC